MDLIYKKIEEKDKEQLFKLIDIVLSGLQDQAYFIPYEQWELDSIFDEVNYAPLYGAYDGEKLVGMAQLYVSQDMLDDFKKEFNLTEYNVCELGGNLVLPEYRGRGITTKLQTMEMELAKELGFDYIISMAHPNNIGSCKTLERIGLEFIKETTLSNGFLRRLYMKKLNLKNLIVITGGSDGLGKSLAEHLSKENNVIILATNEEKLKKVANNNNCKYKVCDVSDYELVENTISEIINDFGRIDVLINNAGLWIQEELDTNDSKRINDVVDVNLLGVINCSKSVIPIMKKHNDGLIININSQAGINHKAERVVYNATKWGVTGFSKSLADEVAKYGIRVTNLMPGMMKTDMFNKMNIQKNMANGVDTKEVVRLIQFIIDTPSDVMIPEVGIKNINN